MCEKASELFVCENVLSANNVPNIRKKKINLFYLLTSHTHYYSTLRIIGKRI
jgi:hypothetical protein